MGPSRAHAYLLSFLALAVQGIGMGLPPDAAITPPDRIILISIDTLRADYVGKKFGTIPLTPNLDRLGASGLRCERAYTPCPLTAPAHASLLTGLDPPRHGVRDNRGFRLAAGVPTLAGRLKSLGYRTLGFTSAATVSRASGLDKGFDLFLDLAPDGGFIPAQRPGGETLDLALPHLLRGGRYFAFLHFFDPHAPYEPPEPWAARFAGDPYAGEVAYTDALVGRLLDGLQSRGLQATTLIAVVSDHGEGLGEHGEQTHGLLAYETTLRVPMLLAGPGIRPGQIADRRSLTDLCPTLLALAGAPLPADGGDGIPLSRPRATPIRFEALYGWLNFGIGPIQGIIQGAYKWLEKSLPGLYDLEQDPGERRNLAPADKIRARTMKRALASAPWDLPPCREASPKRPELTSLGYLAGDLGKGRVPDPDDFVRDYDRWIGAHASMEADDNAGALVIYRGLLARYPESSVLHDETGMALVRSGHVAEALPHFQKSVRVNLNNLVAWVHLGNAHRSLGYGSEAERAYNAALNLDPANGDALYNYGGLLVGLGRTGEARAIFQRYIDALPDGPDSAAVRAWLAEGKTP